MYFQYLPTMMYDPAGDGTAKAVTNILKRARLRINMKKELIMLEKYSVKEGESPEILADKHHGSVYYHWVVMLINDISDINHDWLKSTRQMQQYLENKYTETELYESHHYEIPQTSGDTTIMIEVENSTYPAATSVSNYDYEIALNDSKRSFDLLKNKYLCFFINEFEELM